MSVPKDQVEEFHQTGVICLRGSFGDEWVSALRDIAADCPVRAHAQGFVIADGYVMSLPEGWSFLTRSRLAPICAALLGARRLRLYQDSIMIKRAGSRLATPWHRDAEYYDSAVIGRLCTLWIALDPVDVDNGAVHYVRGSHTDPTLYCMPRSFHRDDGLINPGHPTMPDFLAEQPGAVVHFDLQPGDAVVHHGRTIHGGPANRTLRDRRAVAVSLFADDEHSPAVDRPEWPVVWGS